MSVTLCAEPFAPGALLDRFCAGRNETGAVASFTGLARAEAGATRALELEAYEGFTEAQIAEAVAAATERFGLDDALVVHRVGKVAPGEAVVFVATAAPHRRAAFEACDHLMDFLKSRAPFWKKEHGPDGARWIEPTAADQADAARWDKGVSVLEVLEADVKRKFGLGPRPSDPPLKVTPELIKQSLRDTVFVLLAILAFFVLWVLLR